MRTIIQDLVINDHGDDSAGFTNKQRVACGIGKRGQPLQQIRLAAAEEGPGHPVFPIRPPCTRNLDPGHRRWCPRPTTNTPRRYVSRVRYVV